MNVYCEEISSAKRVHRQRSLRLLTVADFVLFCNPVNEKRPVCLDFTTTMLTIAL